MSFDEGVCYITLSPSEGNPIVEDLHSFTRAYEWFGVIHPPTYAAVPFQINFRSMEPKTEEERKRFERILGMFLEISLKKTVKEVFEAGGLEDRFVESWITVFQGTRLFVQDTNIFLINIYGEVFNTVLQLFYSRIIGSIPSLEKKYNYQITPSRIEPDATLIGTAHREVQREKFIQRLYDRDPKMSSFRWDVGANIRRKYLWKRPWGTFLEPLL